MIPPSLHFEKPNPEIALEGSGFRVITELTLKLHGQPEAISAAICPFPDIDSAVNAVIATIQMGIPMARIEFACADTARAFNAYAGTSMPEAPHLMVEFHGSETGAAEDAERFAEIAHDHGALNGML